MLLLALDGVANGCYIEVDDDMVEGDLVDVAKTNKVPTTVDTYVIEKWTADFPELVLITELVLMGVGNRLTPEAYLNEGWDA